MDPKQARARFRAGNNAGRGFSPTFGGETIAGAVGAFLDVGGATVAHDRQTSDDVVVLALSDGSIIAIGGDALGANPWCVELVDASGRDSLTDERVDP